MTERAERVEPLLLPCKYCNSLVSYSDQHDNFYCIKCNKGQGQEYYVHHKSLLRINMELIDLLEEIAQLRELGERMCNCDVTWGHVCLWHQEINTI